nr:family 10 glycosylhydrolase [Candidatus Sigynarchaeota archaeon]
MDNVKKRLIERIDCNKEPPAGRYFGHDDVHVAESPAGAYREAGNTSFSRFGYRFSIENVGKPHAIAIRYPDDKRRFMCIMDGTSYDLTTGVLTGFTQPLSGKMLDIWQVFWPRWHDCSIVFMTYGEGEPAAVAEIGIYELEALPPLNVQGDLSDGTRREFGIQYEDPCGTAAAEGAIDHAEWIDHVVDYASFSGQKLIVYPMAWYHGPLFPSQREPSDAMDLVVAKDAARTQYTRWVRDPVDWYAKLLERCGERGLEFQGALTLLRLGSLMKQMNSNRRSIIKGRSTINNMLWNDHVQEGAKDWTAIHNAINYDIIAKAIKPGHVVPGFRMPWWHKTYAYGERYGPGYHAGPIFNPLHPDVQAAAIGFVKEVAERYAKYPAFKGITLNMYSTTFLWFGTIHSGYDDYTVNLFEQETSIKVPIRAHDPKRFSKRYEFLNFACPDAWIDWRCRKIRDLMRKIREVLVAARPDLRVTITLWDETLLMPIFGDIGAAHQVFARKSNSILFREAGIDPCLYRDEPGLAIDLSMGCTRDRGGHGRKPAGGIALPPESTSMYRDFDFLDGETHATFKDHASPGVFIFNCWVEAWGKHVWQQCGPGDKNLPALADMNGKKADGILHINSLYPGDGFWWNSQLRIVPAMLGGDHFMEPYAHAVAELDACRITRGGLFLDKAHSGQLQRFARAFRALPRKRFETVGTTTDPVAMRALVDRGRRYFYLVNRDYYPVTVDVAFNQQPGDVIDLASSEKQSMQERTSIELGPYELRTFSAGPGVAIVKFSVTVPETIVDQLTSDAKAALSAIDRARSKGIVLPGLDQIARGIAAAIEERRFAWLRRALTGYVARKCKELDNAKQA